MLSVIVPVYNEEKILLEKKPYYRELGKAARIIFVDGGSQDRTAEIAQGCGRVIFSAKGRGLQKNAGADASVADILLFLHVDTCIDGNILQEIEKAFVQKIQAGCMTLKIDDGRWIFRLFEFLVNLRAKYFGIIDGDLGLIIRRDTFNRLGQFDPVPFMEDILFTKRLRHIKERVVLPSLIHASSRKWHEQGFFKTLSQYARAYWDFWTGMGRFQKL